MPGAKTRAAEGGRARRGISSSQGAKRREAATTEDRILGGRIALIQPREGYRAAIDPVFLAAFVPARSGDLVLEAGGGTGAAALCLLARVPACRVTAVEIDPEMARLARESGARNGMTTRLTVVEGDIASPLAYLVSGAFHHAMMNPPFHAEGHARKSPERTKARANVEGPGGLSAWVKFAHEMLRPKGTLSLIHSADRLSDVLSALSTHHFGGLIVFPLWPGPGKPAKRVLIRGQKGSRAPTILHPGMILHRESGAYTPEADAILRDGTAIEV